MFEGLIPDEELIEAARKQAVGIAIPAATESAAPFIVHYMSTEEERVSIRFFAPDTKPGSTVHRAGVAYRILAPLFEDEAA